MTDLADARRVGRLGNLGARRLARDPADAEPDRATFEVIARRGTTTPSNLQSKEQP